MLDRGRAALVARGDAGAGRRSRVRGRRVGVRLGRSPGSCTTATRSRCIDTDGTLLAERIDGGDMTEVEGAGQRSSPPSRHAATTTSAKLLRRVRGRDDRARRAHRRAFRSRRMPRSSRPSPTTARCRCCSRSAPVGDSLERAADLGWHVGDDRSRRRPRRRMVGARRTGGEPCPPMNARRAAAPI